MDPALTYAQKLVPLMKEGKSLWVTEGLVTLVITPGVAIEGVPNQRCILFTEIGGGSVLIEDLSHFNRYVFAQSGMMLATGTLCTAILKHLIRLVRESTKDPRDHVLALETPL
jgi:hypothetical protein